MPAQSVNGWFGSGAQHRRGSFAAIAIALTLTLGLLACGGGGSASVPLAGQAAPELTAAAPVAFLDGTFAGKTSNPDMFAAVVTHATGVEAYFCDGKRDFWFRGLASESTIEMTDASGAKLSIDIAKDIAVGQLTVGDVVTTFELPSAPGDSLFRADTNVGSTRVLAGWIKLPSGEQRGVIRNGGISLPSTLDTSQFRAGTTVIDPRASCTNCEAVVAALVIAPFTPAAAQIKLNVTQTFTVIGLGDSFMSGDGAPEPYGFFNYDDATGRFTTAIHEEVWAPGLPTRSRNSGGTTAEQQAVKIRDFNLTPEQQTRLAREARACHRGASGLGLAIEAIRQDFQSIGVIHQTFACSGAKIEHLISSQSSGPAGCGKLALEKAALEREIQREIELNLQRPEPVPLAQLNRALASKSTAHERCKTISDDTETNSIQAQIPEAVDFLRAQRLNADAVVMSIGSSDLGFGSIVGECLSTSVDCTDPGGRAAQALGTAASALPRLYQNLAAKFESTGIVGSNTFLTSYPDSFREYELAGCNNDGFIWGYFDQDSNLVVNLWKRSLAFAARVLNKANEQIAAAVNISGRGWKPITSHINSVTRRNYCSGAENTWYWNVNNTLARQGEDLPQELLLPNGDVPGVFGPLQFSAGMLHPNQLGQLEAYKPAYLAALTHAMVTRFTPKPPTRFRPVAFLKDSAGNTSVEVTWDDVNDFETGTTINTTGTTPGTTTIARDTTPRAVISLGAAGTGTLTVKACFSGRNGADLCSTGTPALTVDVKVPTHTPSIVGNAPFTPTSHRLSWLDAAPSKLWSTVEVDTAGVITRFAVNGQSTFVPVAKGLKRFRVAACNTLGCGPATAWTDFLEPSSTAAVPPPCPTGQRLIKLQCEKDNIAKS